FAYGRLSPSCEYDRNEFFYRHAIGSAGGRLRSASKLIEHVPDMLRYRRHAAAADVAHFQWLPVQALDRWLLPTGRRPALVLTSHDILPREPRAGQLHAQRKLYDRFDAIVVHSRRGRERLVGELGVPAERVRVIHHGVFEHLAERPPGRPPPPAPHETDKAVVLMFGLLRGYKGLDVLLDAWRGADGGGAIDGAELWIAGMPRMDLQELRAAAPANVRFDARFVDHGELAGYFERADLVVLPYLQADQSGVLFTALAFGKPLLLSDVGGFPELAADTGAARVVPAGDAPALARALRELLGDRAALTEMCVKARAAAEGDYSWRAAAASHVELYRQLLS
ncbi:MAG TPA: glycosyltransferase family 4 protein, partial [Solirubrobacteraceae bacterium]|nr:glycosyltransferase family 4 protein [Solirubrobacteraceae bacterium]